MSRLAVFLPPLLVLLALPPLFRGNGPFHQASLTDPDYVYLLSALALRTGGTAYHWDHPGATLQALGAATLFSSTAGREKSEVKETVLREPEPWIRVMVVVATAAAALLLALAGALVRRATGSLPLALFAQLFPFLHVLTWEYVPRLTPDLLATVLSLTLLASLLPQLLGKKSALSQREAFTGGLWGGLLLATKVTGAPVLLVPAWLCRRNPKALAAFAGGTLLAFLLPLALVHRGEMANFAAYFLDWAVRLFTREGQYGTGGLGHPGPGLFLSSLLFLASSAPVLIGALAAAGLAARRVSAPRRRTLQLLGAVVLAQLLLSAKHPAPRYLMPALPALGIAFVLLLSWRPLAAKKARAAAAAALLFALLQPVWILLAGSARERAEDTSLKEKLIRDTGCRVYPFYFASGQDFALVFANFMQRDQFSPELGRLYPEFRLLDPQRGILLGLDRMPAPGPGLEGHVCLRGDLLGMPATLAGRKVRVLVPAPNDALFLLGP